MAYVVADTEAVAAKAAFHRTRDGQESVITHVHSYVFRQADGLYLFYYCKLN